MMIAREDPIILDCNVWLSLLMTEDKRLDQQTIHGNTPIIITSYGAVEILRALRRITRRLRISITDIESRFWTCCFFPIIRKEFSFPLSDSIISDIKRAPEYCIIAQLLGIEIKDTPYIIAAYQFKAVLITMDGRSLISKREHIQKQLGVKIIGLNEFLSLYA
jgi:predicted nucleic acid-binding protein